MQWVQHPSPGFNIVCPLMLSLLPLLLLGADMSFSLSVEGTPMPMIRFYKGKRELRDDNRTKIKTDAKTKQVTLTLSKFKPADEGQYSVEMLLKGKTLETHKFAVRMKSTCARLMMLFFG